MDRKETITVRSPLSPHHLRVLALWRLCGVEPEPSVFLAIYKLAGERGVPPVAVVDLLKDVARYNGHA